MEEGFEFTASESTTPAEPTLGGMSDATGQFDSNELTNVGINAAINAEQEQLYGQQYAQQYYSPEQYQPQVQYTPEQLLADLSAGNPQGFLEKLYDSNYGLYEQIVQHLVDSSRDYIAEQTGLNRPYGSQLTITELREIPQNLHAIAAQIPATVWEELRLMPAQQRNMALAAEAQRQELWQENQQYRQYFEQAAQRQAETQYQTQAMAISNQYEQQHRQALEDWAPCGADTEANAAMRESALYGVLASMQKSPHLTRARDEALEMLRGAAWYRAQGQHGFAADYQAQAEYLIQRFNQSFAMRLKRHTAAIDRAYGFAKQQPAQQAPAAPTFDNRGRFTPERIRELAAMVQE